MLPQCLPKSAKIGRFVEGSEGDALRKGIQFWCSFSGAGERSQ
jgi:hypothetical protein